MKFINTILRRFIDLLGSMRLALGSVLFAGMTIAIAALFFFGWLANEVAEGDTANFDDTVRNFVHSFASPALTNLMHIASFLGSTIFLIIFGTIIVIFFLFLKRRRPAAIFAITTVGSGILISTLKLLFKRARPEPFFDTILPASFSFPSGHSLGSLCFYLALAAIITVRIENRIAQIATWITAIFLVLLIGISRIYLGVHFPSDVVAGYAVGLIWVVTIAVGDRLIHVRDKSVLERENIENH
jgi:undecaprenyl-diphosphatase